MTDDSEYVVEESARQSETSSGDHQDESLECLMCELVADSEVGGDLFHVAGLEQHPSDFAGEYLCEGCLQLLAEWKNEARGAMLLVEDDMSNEAVSDFHNAITDVADAHDMRYYGKKTFNAKTGATHD